MQTPIFVIERAIKELKTLNGKFIELNVALTIAKADARGLRRGHKVKAQRIKELEAQMEGIMARVPEGVEEWDQYFEEERFVFVRQSTIDGYKLRIEELEAELQIAQARGEIKELVMDRRYLSRRVKQLEAQVEGVVPRVEFEGLQSVLGTERLQHDKTLEELADAVAANKELWEDMEDMVPIAQFDEEVAAKEEAVGKMLTMEEELDKARAEILELREVLRDDNVLIRSLGEGLFKAEDEIEKLRRKAVWL